MLSRGPGTLTRALPPSSDVCGPAARRSDRASQLDAAIIFAPVGANLTRQDAQEFLDLAGRAHSHCNRSRDVCARRRQCCPRPPAQWSADGRGGACPMMGLASRVWRAADGLARTTGCRHRGNLAHMDTPEDDAPALAHRGQSGRQQGAGTARGPHMSVRTATASVPWSQALRAEPRWPPCKRVRATVLALRGTRELPPVNGRPRRGWCST